MGHQEERLDDLIDRIQDRIIAQGARIRALEVENAEAQRRVQDAVDRARRAEARYEQLVRQIQGMAP